MTRDEMYKKLENDHLWFWQIMTPNQNNITSETIIGFINESLADFESKFKHRALGVYISSKIEFPEKEMPHIENVYIKFSNQPIRFIYISVKKG